MSDDSPPSSIGPYAFEERLGHGGFASVYMGTHNPSGQKVAIKLIKKTRIARDKLAREISLMKSIDHPFIAAFYEFLEDEVNYYIILELCEGGSLLELVSRLKVLPPRSVRRILAELVCALEYVHNKIRAAHRDIKLENIMFDKHNNIRVIDFGLGNLVSGEGMLQTACGSPAYAAPEILRHKPYTVEADIWAAGVVTFAMTYGKLPWWNNNVQTMAESIVREETVYSDLAPGELIKLMKRMLTKDDTLRITLDGIRKSPFMSADPLIELLDETFDALWKGENGESVTAKIQRRWTMVDQLELAIQNGLSVERRTPMRRMSYGIKKVGNATPEQRNVRSMNPPQPIVPVPLIVPVPQMQRAGQAIIARHRTMRRQRSTSHNGRVEDDPVFD